MHLTIPECALVVLIGPSGAGKSTFAQCHFRPTEVLSRKRYIELQFPGITPASRSAISQGGMVGIYASYHGEWWDALADLNVVVRRTSTGQYFCGLCHVPGDVCLPRRAVGRAEF
jgi:ABC-type uncharacterized transport system ATPase subunit